ncbi:MAG: CPBP family intramembrane metalloprotease [Sandaracinaceae bacterium]|nr:CPBP family intramembrane metalloprotease [Myxococcales bacterium]MCB9656418.1 CPBP family intramembrane metalloprotease [Sandaracinaceae bacterium]
MRRVLLAIGASLCAVGLLLTMSRVGELATEERDYRGPLLTMGELTGSSAVLGELTLAHGQSVNFSVCATDAFYLPGWKVSTFAIFHEDPHELVLRVRLDQDRMASLREAPEGGCVDLARADALTGRGRFSVVLETPGSGEFTVVRQVSAADTRLWTHVTAVRTLTAADMTGPLLAWVGVLLMTLAWLVRPPPRSAFEQLVDDALAADAEDIHAPRRSPLGPSRVLAAALLGLVVSFVASALLPPSPLTSIGAALVLFLGQLLLVVGLTRHAQGLGLVAPPRWPWLLLAMPVLGVVLRIALAQISRLVPSTGTAPIEHMVSAPSGLLTMLAIGLVAPFAEELFFRGLLFRQLERLRGPVPAVVGTALLFALLHAPQVFGAWPSLVSITVAGVAFSTLRALTGSTLASILAHLGYNGIIALPFILQLLAR